MFVNGSITGYGKFTFNSLDNKIYIGQFCNGEMLGFGQILTDNFIYRGFVKNGKFEGYGVYQDLNSNETYKGIFKDGRLIKQEH